MPAAYTYDDNSIREDLLDIITNLTPTETQLVSGLGTSTANAVYHQWLKDTLKAVATVAAVEGANATSKTTTNPSRLINITQIIDNTYQVSGTERAVVNAGFEDRLAYERTKAMREWKNDAELALMRGSMVCGSGSAARQLKGIKNWLTNVTARSGVSLTEAELNNRFQDVWDDGTQVNAVYCPMYIKRKIAAFVGNATQKNVAVDDKRLVNAVDVYEADAASMVKLFAHRYVTIAGDNNYDLVGINEDFFKIAYLRKPNTTPLAKSGDSDTEQLLAELTLECLHADAGFWQAAVL